MHLDQKEAQQVIHSANNSGGSFKVNEQFLSELKALADLINDFETDAADLAEEITEKLQGSGLVTVFSRIGKHIENYEFEEAGEALAKFSETLSNS
jgi:hypothetical protein